MLHLLYILAFTTLAFIAVRNLIRSLWTVGMESQRYNSHSSGGFRSADSINSQNIHPELLDESGNVLKEPLLVMRSLSVQDARTQLDNLYQSSPGSGEETRDDS
ncbi:MAG: DUF2973 domain-containing protein [Arthrospira sp. SH-MAG29]|nr:DUF2973 domain-containing protein [Arthrospira sp. SH-MAG29]MBS0018083.1 DUF2973 domain-containing protein [Arthrospira sp. SH-MAG29]